jgi:hypothetical protein
MRKDRALMTQEVEFFWANGFEELTGLLSEDEVAPISDEIGQDH